MTNPPNLVITGLDGYFILNFLQKSGYIVLILITFYNTFIEIDDIFYYNDMFINFVRIFQTIYTIYILTYLFDEPLKCSTI